MKILPFCEFYVRRSFQRQPFAISVMIVSFLMAACACYAAWDWTMHSQALSLQLQEVGIHTPTSSPAASASDNIDGNLMLPVFSAAEFVEQFSTIAREAKVPVDELFYVLETGQAQPFWRYRITVDAKTGYPELRKFVAALASEMPNVTLDTVRCHRDSASDASLSCQLAFSAFFRESPRG